MSDLADRLWASLPVPAILLNGANGFAAVNPVAEEFLNASSRAILGAPAFDRLIVDPSVEASVARVRAEGTPLFVNNVDVTAGDRPAMPCDIQLAPMSGQADHVLLLIEMRHIAHRLGQAHSARAAARSAVGMAEMLAHEIKNPLAGITGAAQLLGMSLSGDDLEMTDLIVAETRRIAKLLEQVEQFGNLRPPARKAVNVHDLLDRVRRSASLGFGAHMRLVERYDPSLPQTFVDADQMLQVFMNLVKNAAEASPSGGTIELSTFYDTSLRVRLKSGAVRALPLQVEIVDDGPGLPPEIAAEVFEPFVSGRENGTGLGLALVSKIVSEHEGWITVDSVPGRTVFRISLPVAAPAGPDKEEEQSRWTERSSSQTTTAPYARS